MTRQAKDELRTLANVGPAARADFRRLGISTLAELSGQEASDLYERLCRLTGGRQDPCVQDVFAAAIHQARTGEITRWWDWSRKRKAGIPVPVR